MKCKFIVVSMMILCACMHLQAQEVMKAPDRQRGDGPWKQLIIRGAILIDGTLSPPLGPMDIVVENNRIKSIHWAGARGSSAYSGEPAVLQPGGKELDARGMYLMPGFVDTHFHIGGKKTGNAEYVFKLALAHGVTTVRDPGSGNGLDWVLDQKERSRLNEITAPRIKAYQRFGNDGSKIDIPTTAQEAREWIRKTAKQGADGIKDAGFEPEVISAAIDEANKLGLGTMTHHRQTMVGNWNVLHSARAGSQGMEHWYGLPEALFTDRRVQDYSRGYNYQDEHDRFGEAGELWKQAAPPFSEKWNAVMDELISLDYTLSPTFNVYEATRDLMAAQRREWQEIYTLPSLWEFWSPTGLHHGSFWHSWGTEQETAWKENYKLWMVFVNEYKNRAARVTVGTDARSLDKLFGFSVINEMELLREPGVYPLEVIEAATMNGAEILGMEKEIGSVKVGKLADFVLVVENPLENLASMSGTGTIELQENGDLIRVGGVKYTIKDGIIYDAKQLLEDVRNLVAKEKEKYGYK